VWWCTIRSRSWSISVSPCRLLRPAPPPLAPPARTFVLCSRVSLGGGVKAGSSAWKRAEGGRGNRLSRSAVPVSWEAFSLFFHCMGSRPPSSAAVPEKSAGLLAWPRRWLVSHVAEGAHGQQRGCTGSQPLTRGRAFHQEAESGRGGRARAQSGARALGLQPCAEIELFAGC